MSHVKIRKLVLAALFAALCTVMTLVIQIPSPMQGYVNLGDCAVLLSAWVLGPVYGGVAAGTGSMLADLFSGYAHYAPGTFLIKLCMAVAAALIFRFLRNRPASKLLLAQGASVGCHGGRILRLFLLVAGQGSGCRRFYPGQRRARRPWPRHGHCDLCPFKPQLRAGPYLISIRTALTSSGPFLLKKSPFFQLQPSPSP